MSNFKGLGQFEVFDINAFLKGKDLMLMQENDWVDYQRNAVIGTKLVTTILTDDTEYQKPGINNVGLNVDVKIRGVQARKCDAGRYFIKLNNPRAKVYGDYRNQLSVEADGFEIVKDLRGGKN